MNVVIVCESMFGNTELLAQAVRAGLESSGAQVRLVDVEAAGPEDVSSCDLLVVAAPTHALTLSRPESRAQAVERGADPRRARTGVREWLAALHDLLPVDGARPPVAVFDTRVVKAKHWPGSAASRAARTLRRQGFTVVSRISFYVEGITGPLAPREMQRAVAWGTGLPGRRSEVSHPSSGTA
jgi:hypothetical protein